MADYEYECALSGLTTEAADHDDSDGLGELPVGWTEIRIRRRQYNPRWLAIQQVKESSVMGLLAQLPPEIRASQELGIRVQIDATFFGLEDSTPMYLSDIEDVVYLSDSEDILEGINEVRGSLGLDPVVQDEDEDEEEDSEVGDVPGTDDDDDDDSQESSP